MENDTAGLPNNIVVREKCIRSFQVDRGELRILLTFTLDEISPDS